MTPTLTVTPEALDVCTDAQWMEIKRFLSNPTTRSLRVVRGYQTKDAGRDYLHFTRDSIASEHEEHGGIAPDGQVST